MLSNQTAWRKANLASKLSLDNLEKESLLYGGDSGLRQSDITESLMSISLMMSQQVMQSEETMTTLGEWLPLVYRERSRRQTGTIQLGRKLITKYNRRELTDKLLIFLALALFLAKFFYILKNILFFL
ncbi:unnamed protein product [Coregonus sp. 'balchen']|nr:unnamed protein product [Coregonus sp. 'balchen']